MKKIVFMFESTVLCKDITIVEDKSKLKLYHKNTTPVFKLDNNTEYINIYLEVVMKLIRWRVYDNIVVMNTLKLLEDSRGYNYIGYNELDFLDQCSIVYIIDLLTSRIIENLTSLVVLNYIQNYSNTTFIGPLNKYCIIHDNYIDIIYDGFRSKYVNEFLEEFKIPKEFQGILYRLMKKDKTSETSYKLRFINDIDRSILKEFIISDDNKEDTIL